MHGRVRREQDVVWAHGGLCDGGEVAQVGLVRANEAKLVLDLGADTGHQDTYGACELVT